MRAEQVHHVGPNFSVLILFGIFRGHAESLRTGFSQRGPTSTCPCSSKRGHQAVLCGMFRSPEAILSAPADLASEQRAGLPFLSIRLLWRNFAPNLANVLDATSPPQMLMRRRCTISADIVFSVGLSVVKFRLIRGKKLEFEGAVTAVGTKGCGSESSQ